MTFSKILATTTLVGMMGSTAFANDINFLQSGGSIGVVKFSQSGVGHIISSNGTSLSAAATVVGSLATLDINQENSSNAASFAITTGFASEGKVKINMFGNSNVSKLTVTQSSTDKLDYNISFGGLDNSVDATISAKDSSFFLTSQGDRNSVVAVISAETSLVALEFDGTDMTYTIGQTGVIDNTNSHSITANARKMEAGVANIAMNQSGAVNTITLGTVDTGRSSNGTGGLTLRGAAEVGITQSSDSASYTATQTVANGGSITVTQTN
jgi:hypothetical protein